MFPTSSYCLPQRVSTATIFLVFFLVFLLLRNIIRYEDIVELLLKHGGRIDVEARMCWPGPHNQNCEERFKNCKIQEKSILFIIHL